MTVEVGERGIVRQEEIRAALDSALAGTLPHEGWEQNVGEVFASVAAGVSARAGALLWDHGECVEDDGPQTDWAIDRWWIVAREALIDQLAPVYLAHAATRPDHPLALSLRLRRSAP